MVLSFRISPKTWCYLSIYRSINLLYLYTFTSMHFSMTNTYVPHTCRYFQVSSPTRAQDCISRLPEAPCSDGEAPNFCCWPWLLHLGAMGEWFRHPTVNVVIVCIWLFSYVHFVSFLLLGVYLCLFNFFICFGLFIPVFLYSYAIINMFMHLFKQIVY